MSDESIYTMSGTRIFISENAVTKKASVTPTDFDGVSWTEIGGLYNVGSIGGEQTFNTFELINSEWMQVSKGGRDGGTMANQFVPMALDPGQIKLDAAVEDKCGAYAIKVERGADCSPTEDVTFSDGSGDLLVAWTGSDFTAGQPVVFTTDSGTLPTGIDSGTVYYVVNPSADSFSVAATVGGTPIEFTDAGSGTIVATAPPAGMTNLFQAMIGDGEDTGGGKNDGYFRTWNFRINGRVIRI